MDGDFLPRDPAQLMNNVTYLNEVGVTERDVMIGVNNEEGGLQMRGANFYTGDDDIAEFYQVVAKRY